MTFTFGLIQIALIVTWFPMEKSLSGWILYAQLHWQLWLSEIFCKRAYCCLRNETKPDFKRSSTWMIIIIFCILICNIYILFDGLAYNTCGYFASCVVFFRAPQGQASIEQNVRSCYMLRHRIRGLLFHYKKNIILQLAFILLVRVFRNTPWFRLWKWR